MYKDKQRTQSKWDKVIDATQRNTIVNHKKLPFDFVKASIRLNYRKKYKLQRVANGLKPREDETVQALWRLRDEMIEDGLGIEHNLTSDFNGSLNHQQS